MRKRGLYLAVIMCLTAVIATGQTNRMLRLQAASAMAAKDWYGATQYYARLFTSDSSSTKLRYNYAEASRLNFDLDLAQRLYQQVIALDNGRRFPLSYYRMGQLLKTKAQYKEAKKWFVKFNRLKGLKRKYDYYAQRSKQEAEACDMALLLLKQPVSGPPEHLDASVNSKESEYAAFEKDSSLYFSSLRNPLKKESEQVNFNKIYKVDFRNHKWQKVKALDTMVNATYLHNANTCFSDDQQQMIVSRCTAVNASEYSCELYAGTFRNNRWQAFQRMPEPVNIQGFSTSMPALGEVDGRTVLFFSSNRPGGEGGMDIWYSVKDNSGQFGEPVNAGKKVNTPEDEITPWYVSDKNTLFFSSTYHKGFGGFDIFKSRLLNGDFTDPENAGSPVNSSYNDVYYSTNKNATRAYVSSNRVGSFFENKVNCCNDIYRFSINTETVEPVVKADSTMRVKEQIRLLVPLTLYFHNDEPDPKTTATSTSKNYEATFAAYQALQKEYSREFSSGLKGDLKVMAKNRTDGFFEDSLKAGLDDLHRFTGLLERTLRQGETVKITLKGYCSPLAGTEYNKNLARRRISSLRNYFNEAHNGVFLPYINNQAPGQGRLLFEEVDIGELPVSKASDDFKDRRNSVYSPYAASERKIQIIAVSFGVE